MDETGAQAGAHDAVVATNSGGPDEVALARDAVARQTAKVEKFKGLLAQCEAGLAAAEADLAALEG